MKKLLALFLIFGALQAEELTVELATGAKLAPIYVTPWAAAKQREQLPSSYLGELHQALMFDLNYNGHTEVAAATPERRAQASKGQNRPDAAAWRKLGVRYLVRGQVAGDHLALRLFSTASDTQVGVYEVPLTGNSHTDRRRIHQLADTIHKALFRTNGIANTQILYTVTRRGAADEKPRSEVWIADYDGSNARQLTHEGDFCVTPQFMPPAAGKASGGFLFVCYRTGQPKIYMGRLHSDEVTRLTTLRGNQLMPTVAPLRDQIAFVSDAGGNPDLFILPFDPASGPKERPHQIYSARGGAQASPTFSPDGRQVAFVSNKDGPARIYLIDTPDLESRRRPKARLITLRNRENTSPSWSPDGRRIAYSSMTSGTRQIWIYDVRSGVETQLTNGPGHKENPAWAPDGLHLVFNSSRGNNCQLYMVNLNQPKPIRISRGSGEKRFPAWGVAG